ncbi:cadherin-23-like isoform X2 [Physella acuta]|nr:cadherin-23-like isoform X2 [Physella acuta]XP_059146714.1 cadherin-23-like isoform X2 [Physella acuta]
MTNVPRNVSVVITDVNDNAPTFQNTPFNVTINESYATPGYVVITLSATDKDCTQLNFLYSVSKIIYGNTTAGQWQFNSSVPGQLELKSLIDLDTPGATDYMLIMLTVQDQGSPPLSSSAILTVHILPDNEFPPNITFTPGPINISENIVVGQLIGSLTVEDRDYGPEGKLKYNITSGNTNNVFMVDNVGNIKTVSKLNAAQHPSYQLVIQISDSGVDPRTATATVVVNVTAVDEHIPECVDPYIIIDLLETSAINSSVANLSCHDQDGDILIYTVKRFNETFGFINGTADLILLSGVDYDSSQQNYVVEIEVSDGIFGITVLVVVNLLPVNEFPPVFNPSIVSINVTENKIVANPVLVFSATDMDYSPHNISNYTIYSVSNNGRQLFEIDHRTGALSVLSKLDYELLPSNDTSYTVVVIAMDGGGLNATGTVTVNVLDVNDNAPACLRSVYTKNVNEKQNGSGPYNLLTLGCFDAEDKNKLNYTLDQTPGNHFSIVNDTVELVNDSLDYETATGHKLTIVVSDFGNPVQSTTVFVFVTVVNMNDGPPVFPVYPDQLVNETETVGHLILVVNASDPDGKDPVFGDPQYTIINGDSNQQFTIGATNGDISLRKPLDYEQTKNYTLTIQAKERGGELSATVSINILVLDVNDEVPVCNPSFVLVNRPETLPINSVIASVSCTDRDDNSVLTYNLTKGNNTLFQINGSTVILGSALDYETKTFHDLALSVSDGVHTINVDVVVNVEDVDDGPPVFEQDLYHLNVSEATPISTVLVTVKANDPDTPTSRNGMVRYSFVSSDPRFRIDPKSGNISLAEMLDRETVATYTLIVRAADALNSTNSTVFISVTDVNDNTPAFTSDIYKGTLKETDGPGTYVLTVTATDRDDPNFNDYGVVSYAIVGGSPYFAINSTTGTITNSKTLSVDTSKKSDYTLVVSASDAGGRTDSLNSTAVVTIVVTTVNDYAPQFLPGPYSIVINETQFKFGDAILMLTAYDNDTSKDGEFTFAFQSPQTKFSITQNGSVCEIRLNDNLDFENNDTRYELVVIVTDKGVPPKSGSGTVTIIVNDVNDNPPVCGSVINVERKEGATQIATLTCSDKDQNTKLNYSLISVEPNKITLVISPAGEVNVSTPLDYEVAPFYHILIKVEDTSQPFFNTTVSINLKLIDVNDNDPTISGPLVFAVNETDTISNRVLYHVNASSNDGPTDVLRYFLLDKTYFDITEATGEITLKNNAPDYEMVGGMYLLPVCVEDSPNPVRRKDCKNITVTIIDVNDMSPIFNPSVYAAAVRENISQITLSPPVRATDGDATPAFANITYSIVAGDPLGNFRISQDGNITVISPLDYEKITMYDLIIQASDSLNTANASYNIIVLPVNEFDPIFNSTNQTLSIKENTPVNSNVTLQVFATDDDKGPDGDIYYSISSVDNKAVPFIIDPKSGEIRAIANIDREVDQSFFLLVKATDGGNPARTGTLSLTVSVTDVNDNAPHCSSNFYPAFISEAAGANTLVATLRCQDDDNDPYKLNNNLTYSFVSGETDAFFIDDAATLRVKPNIVLDRETDASYKLIIKVADSSPVQKLSVTVTVFVTIQDVNDNAPMFSTVIAPTIAEDTNVGAEVATVSAVDRDAGDNAAVLYSITSGNTDDTFTIDVLKGTVILQKALDYETTKKYVLLITAQDKGTPALSTTVNMTVEVKDVNDSPPVCATSVYTSTQVENTHDVTIATVNCTDADTVGVVSYSITDGNDNNSFNINSSSGIVKVNVNATLDYEKTQFYTLEITASDGVHTAKTYVKVAVKDEDEFPPQFTPPGPFNVSVKENLTLDSLLIKFNATDGDIFDNIKIFTIQSGNEDRIFFIDKITGSLRLQNPLDYETRTNFTLHIQVTDSGNLSSVAVIDIVVEDVDDNIPVCLDTVVVVSVDENVTTAIPFTPECSDKDTVIPSDGRYTLQSGAFPELLFNSTTGQLALKAPLDYENMTYHEVTIKAYGGGTPDLGVILMVRINVRPVNEFTPVFVNTGPFAVPENATIGTLVGQINATDQDKGLLQGTVRYYIVGGDPDEQFDINEMTGEIKTTSPLDHEVTANYTLIVEAVDDLPTSANQRRVNATVNITIEDVNDNPPVFNSSIYRGTLLENDAANTLIVTVTATDRDDPNTNDNGRVKYRIVPGSNSSKFSINETTGEIRNTEVLDADLTGVTLYKLTVTATDHNGQSGALTATTLVAVDVKTVNEFPPVFNLSLYSVTVNETQLKNGDTILLISAMDNDTGPDGDFVFSFVVSQPKFSLVQRGRQAEILLDGVFDYDQNDTLFEFQVQAIDKGVPARSGAAKISIRVTDVNDNPPMCVSVINIDRPENTDKITNITCTDVDTNTQLAYNVTSVTPANIQPVVSPLGEVSVLTALDFEKGTAYTIVILVIDKSSGNPVQSASVTINLRVTDINESPPSFSGPFSFTVHENDSASNVVLYRCNASGNDGPSDVVTFSLTDTTYFAVAPKSGEVTLKTKAPDFETVGPVYKLEVCARDTANPVAFTTCQNITVNVIDVNDMSPIFRPEVYTVSVPEDAVVGTRLKLAVTATDGDTTPAYHTVTYQILAGNMDGKWRINSSSGEIEVAGGLDYENVTSYSLVIQATDNTYTTNASYTIQIQSVNEYPPEFSAAAESVTISEDTLTNYTFKLKATVTDGDAGPDGMFTFSIDSGPLAIDPVTGQLSLVTSLDRETTQTITLRVMATDKGKPPKSGVLSLTVNVGDVNDNAPACAKGFSTTSFPENYQAINSIIAVLDCKDADKDPEMRNNAISYTLASNISGKFEVNPTTGVVKVKDGEVFDREAQSLYKIVILVADNGTSIRLSTTVTIDVAIADSNDNPPYFTYVPLVTVLENVTAGTVLEHIIAKDNDTGLNAQLTYSITSGNIGNVFRIDMVDGTLLLQGSLDYETIPLYQLGISVTDKGSPKLSATATVTVSVQDVNDCPPVCNSTLYVDEIPENSKGITLAVISCRDPDTVGTLTYSITDGNQNNTFNINSTTGEVILPANANLDYEEVQSYTLEVTVSDQSHSLKIYLKVEVTDVNEASPVFTPSGPYTKSVPESIKVGSVVFDVNATDADKFDLVKIFSIIAGNAEGKFSMDPGSGIIRTLAPLDYEQKTFYTLTLLVQDSTGLSSNTTLNVTVTDVNDNPPVCTDLAAVVSVDENVNSRVLFTPNCTDADKSASPVLQYSILSGNNVALAFSNTSGQLSLQSAFDYEKTTAVTVVMKVSDNGSPELFVLINVTININPVNEYSPQFVPGTAIGPFSVPENVTLGYLVTKLNATDDDKGLLQGTVRYQIISGDPQQFFNIDQNSGAIKVIRALDRETTPSYNLTVKASDDEPGSPNQRTATATVSIKVSDINDMTPVFTPALYFQTVSENAVAGPNVNIVDLTVQDEDEPGVNSQMTITITAGNGENKFSINGTHLVLQNGLDYEKTKRYELTLTVTDGGSPQLSSSGLVVIDVTPFNEAAPLMNISSLTKEIPEDTPVGTLVFDADASDLDGGMQGQIVYSIESGVSNNDFVLDPTTGRLYVGSSLDFDQGPKSYSIIIRATDGAGSSSKTSTASLSVILSDVNDISPQFSQSTYLFNVNENMVNGTTVGTLTVTDGDSDLNGKISLVITGGSGQNMFRVNGTTLEIVTNAVFDYEKDKILSLSVLARDGGTPSRNTTCFVQVGINNMNDNQPVIVPMDFTTQVSEGLAVGAVVQTFSATDLDNGVDTYSIVGTSSFFDINLSTGEVTLKSALDREKIQNHTLQVQVVDKPTSVDTSLHTATATLTVLVGDVNDNPPVIATIPPTTIPDTLSVNRLVLRVQASDLDEGVNGLITYSINAAGNVGGAFKIDSAGNLLVANALNANQVNHYTLTIQAIDNGVPQLVATATAEITVISLNRPPVFDSSSYLFTVSENSPVGTAVGLVNAQDIDLGAEGHVTYSFVTFTLGNFAHFKINSTTGEITVAYSNIDRETDALYKGIVQAMDGGSPGLTATTEISISITDVDDNGPVFSPSVYRMEVKENLPLGTSVLQLNKTDADTSANAGAIYSIITTLSDGSVAAQYFQVDQTGVVSTSVNKLDYEQVKSLNFLIRATGPNTLTSSTASVYITVTDENDNAPKFKSEFVNGEVAYNKECSTKITTVTATDADTGENARVTYTLDNSNGALFSINSLTGELTLDGTALANKKYTVLVKANDNGVPQLTSTTTVRIDTFIPKEVAISFALSISRASFVAQQDTFIKNMQDALRKKYPQAVLRLWCVQERDGAIARRKRQTTSKPVTVSVYSLKDGTTESADQITQDKMYLSQSELLSAVSTNGVPNSDIAGSTFAYFKINEVQKYSETSSSSYDWWDTIYGPIITAILIALGLILIAIVIVCCWRYHHKKKSSEDSSLQSSSHEASNIPNHHPAQRHFRGYRDVEFYPTYPMPYPVRMVNEESEYFASPRLAYKQYRV